MQSIEFTEEHKSKLLEMCKELFPEFNKNDETGFGGWYIGKKTQHTHLIAYLKDGFNDKLEDPDLYIHWFEFCVNYLFKKIGIYYYNYVRTCKESKSKPHLVDYLYETWKKH